MNNLKKKTRCITTHLICLNSSLTTIQSEGATEISHTSYRKKDFQQLQQLVTTGCNENPSPIRRRDWIWSTFLIQKTLYRMPACAVLNYTLEHTYTQIHTHTYIVSHAVCNDIWCNMGSATRFAGGGHRKLSAGWWGWWVLARSSSCRDLRPKTVLPLGLSQKGISCVWRWVICYG